jgi:hypothetical protein
VRDMRNNVPRSLRRDSMKPLGILKTYFNSQNDPAGYVKLPLKDFATEVKALDPAEKDELVQLAAAEMGVEVEAA